MNPIGKLAALLVLLARPLAALPPGPTDTGDDEAAEIAKLTAILEEETRIATRTRMNADFIPGIVTVLHGEDLRALGVKTVWEALALVPSMQLTLADGASPSVIVRAMPFSFNSGNIKVLVNSVPMSGESSGVNSSILYIPIEQVDRIEVLRGPGAAIHGDFASAGVVNILTRASARGAALEYRGHETFAGGAGFSWSSKDGSTRGSLVAGGLTSQDADAREPFDADEDRHSVFASFAHRGFALRGQLIGRDFDERADQQPAPRPGPRSARERSWSVGASQELALRKDLALALRGGVVSNEQRVFPTEFDGRSYQLAGDLVWKRGRNELVVGGEFWETSVHRMVQIRPPNLGLPDLELRDIERRIWSVTLQDQFGASASLSLIAGLRLDHLSDVGSHWSPRLAAVWRASDRHVLKAQYAQAFRAPVFFELYDTGRRHPDLDVTRFGTFEASYIYRAPSSTGRLTLFHARLWDAIAPGPAGFENSGGQTVPGADLEWSQQVAGRVKLSASLTYLDPRNDPPERGESHWLGAAAAIARPVRWLALGARFTHAGTRFVSGRRFDSLSLLDLSVSLEGLPVKGLAVRAGVKNVLDRETMYPVWRPVGEPSELAFRGRSGWLSLAYDFQ